LTQTTLYSRVLVKIGAERGNLLNESKLKTLTESKNVQELATQLRDSSYQEQIAKAPLPLTSRKLERAFNENLIESYLKIVKNSPKIAKNYLDLFLLRFEVENIKALIKATSAKLSLEQKIAKVYVSVENYLENRAVMEEASKALSIRQVVSVLNNTEYVSALNIGLQRYEETGSTMCFDVFIDKLFYEHLNKGYESLPKKEKPHARFYASIENASFVLLTLLRAKALNYDADWLRMAVPHGNLGLRKETIEAIASAADFESALKIVLESDYAKFFTRAANAEETIASAEKAFLKAMFKQAKASIIREIFNIGSPLAFITQKKVEVLNLTALSLGVEAAMKPEDIQLQLLT
jgi:vacuolar-type H+-ATPase subunit C/Vma6